MTTGESLVDRVSRVWTSLEGCEGRTTAVSNAVQGLSENDRNDADGFLGLIEGCVTQSRAS
jgi:hypothetical protein